MNRAQTPRQAAKVSNDLGSEVVNLKQQCVHLFLFTHWIISIIETMGRRT